MGRPPKYRSQNLHPPNPPSTLQPAWCLTVPWESEVSMEGARQEGAEAENGDNLRFKSLHFPSRPQADSPPPSASVFSSVENNSCIKALLCCFNSVPYEASTQRS